MVNLVSLLSILLLFSTCTPENQLTPAGDKAISKPNVILIITDDQGYGDLGFHGNPYIQTPVLDSLAQVSTRLNNFYVSPVCAPTRSSLMTGRYSLRTGVYDTYNGGAIMATEEVTLAELLRDGGYTTGIFGKWHLGDTYPHRPQDQGFSHTLIHPGGGMGQVGDVENFFKYDSAYFNPTLWENGKAIKKEGYCSDIFTDGAIAFMRDHQKEPFFLYLSFNAPHTPLQLPQEYYDQYANLQMDSAQLALDGKPYPAMTTKNLEDAKRVYGMVSNIDDNLRRLFSQLNHLGLRENTLLIFITDNGAQQPRYSAGLRGLKTTVYEGGIKVPCFMSYPKALPSDQEVEGTYAHIDLPPTILSFCNVPIPEGVDFDGKDLTQILKKSTPDSLDRPLFSFWDRGYPEPYQNIAVRQGPYKLVGHAPADAHLDQFELFNIMEDPYEQNNLSQTYPEQVQVLKDAFDQWYGEIITSEHLVNFPRIHIGSDYENPVVLNRNDAKVAAGIWAEENKYEYWDVKVTSAGTYDFSCFLKTTKPEGKLTLRIGTTQRSMAHTDTASQKVEISGLALQPGNYRCEAWYTEKSNGSVSFPFFIEVEKQSK